MSTAAIQRALNIDAANDITMSKHGKVPRMMTGKPQSHHRERKPDVMPIGFASVARTLNKVEIRSSKGAQAAVRKELDKLRAAGAWDESKVREYSDVAREARRTGKTVHFGRVFPICVEKDAELKRPEALKVYKGRVVFQGNQVKD